jgi:thioredoxin reductase (NADPH)
VDREATGRPDLSPRPFESSVPGVFAIGDNRRGSVKRIATAVGDGAGVVQLLHGYLAEVAAVPDGR